MYPPTSSPPEPRVRPYSAVLDLAAAAGSATQGVTKRLASAFDRWASSVVLRGKEKHSQRPLRALYFGTGNHLEYLAGLAFAPEPERVEGPTVKAWRSLAAIDNLRDEVDLILLDLPWPYHRSVPRHRFLESPAWMQQRLVLASRWDDVVRSFRKNTRGGQRRKIRRYGLSYRVTHDPDAARSFYDDFYHHHVAARFGSAAVYLPRSYIEDAISRGALLQVGASDEVLGAIVLCRWGNCLQLVFAGLNGDIEDRAYRYVFPALYYYAIRYGFEQGFTEIDMTGSRPLLNDGLVRFKRQWGAGLYDGWSWGLDTLMIRPVNLDPAVSSFLGANSWIVRSDRGLVGKILLGEEANEDQMVHLTKSYSCPGLQSLTFYCQGGVSQKMQERAATLPGAVQLVELGTSEGAIDQFCCR